MRKLRVRTYFILILLLFLLLPWFFFLTVNLLSTHSLRFGEERPSSFLVLMTVFGGLLLAFFIAGAWMRRLLLSPLESMGQAARQIATGDLDVRLPDSAVREIAEVRDGFEVMVDGLQSAYRKQTELEEERRFMIAAVAHDLRTPLFALRGYLDGLEQGIARTPEQMAKYAAICKEKAAHLDRLVEDLFTYTKMEYPESALRENTCHFNEIVQKAVESLKPQSRQMRISVVTHYAEDACVIRADAHLLERALSNLLDNAVRHTPAHGRILIQCSQEEDRVRFTIQDSGPGFAPEELEYIFEPLYRGEQSRNRDTGGAGLGLAISRRIIRQHGGELNADNDPDGGAILTGWIPANRI